MRVDEQVDKLKLHALLSRPLSPHRSSTSITPHITYMGIQQEQQYENRKGPPKRQSEKGGTVCRYTNISARLENCTHNMELVRRFPSTTPSHTTALTWGPLLLCMCTTAVMIAKIATLISMMVLFTFWNILRNFLVWGLPYFCWYRYAYRCANLILEYSLLCLLLTLLLLAWWHALRG